MQRLLARARGEDESRLYGGPVSGDEPAGVLPDRAAGDSGNRPVRAGARSAADRSAPAGGERLPITDARLEDSGHTLDRTRQADRRLKDAQDALIGVQLG